MVMMTNGGYGALLEWWLAWKKPNYAEKILLQWQFDNHISRSHCFGSERAARKWEVSD
jgi:hypothetical protein